MLWLVSANDVPSKSIPLGAPSQRNDLIIASLAIRHLAPLISHNYRDFNNIDALDPSHRGTDPQNLFNDTSRRQAGGVNTGESCA